MANEILSEYHQLRNKHVEVLMSVFDGFLLKFFKRHYYYKQVVDILDKSAKSVISPEKDITLGMSYERLRSVLEGCILREDKNVCNELDAIISAKYSNLIYRYVVKFNMVLGVIVEVGIEYNYFDSVYKQLEDYFVYELKSTVNVEVDQESKRPFFNWECYGNKYFALASMDKIAYLNPLFPLYRYFNGEIDGTFIRKRAKKWELLPTIAIVISKDKDVFEYSKLFLRTDFNKREMALYDLKIGIPLD